MAIDWDTAQWRRSDSSPNMVVAPYTITVDGLQRNGERKICICHTDDVAEAIAGLPELVRAARRVAKAAAAAVRIGVNVSPSKTNRVLRAALAPYER